MDDAAINTKLERVVEAQENLAHAIFDGRSTARNADRSKVDQVTTAIIDAREEMRQALREFLQPRLRVLTGGAQPYAHGVSLEDRVKCATCGQTTPCRAVCGAWAMAVRMMVDPEHGGGAA